jgi:thiol-disulfide isomerase/thioredoxin
MSFSDSRHELPPQAKGSSPWILWFAALLLGSFFVWRMFFATSDLSDRGPGNPAVGRQLTVLELQPLTGDAKPITSASLQGKVTLVNYWGPWCGYCVVEFPHLVEIERHFRDNPDFQFLSVSASGQMGDDTAMLPSTAEFLQSHQADFPTYRDPDAVSRRELVTQARLDGFGFPTTVILDRQGNIRGLWVGFRKGDELVMQQVVEDTLRQGK